MTITPALLLLLLIFLRVLGMIGTAPVISNAQIPVWFKIGFALFLALIIDSTLTKQQSFQWSHGLDFPHFIILALIETLTGIAIGLIANTTFAITQFAGELLDQQVGFSIVSLISPGMVSPTGLLSNFYYIVFAVWFLSINGHYVVVLAIMQSFQVIPIGHAILFSGSLGKLFLDALIELMTMGLQLAAPVLIALFLTNVSLAVASKAVTQINVFSVGLPLTLLIGLLFIGMLLPDIVGSLQSIVLAMENDLNHLLGVLRSG
nr:flagellar biosynthetic protein FliR [Bacilli bacterium]